MHSPTHGRRLAPWLSIVAPRPDAAIRLVCFPYAGGTSGIFRGWADRLPPAIELLAVELPGRGARLREPAYTSLPALVADLSPTLADLGDRPVAYYGHSLGAAIAFEVCRWLRRRRRPLPVHLIVSGRRAPQTPNLQPPSWNLDDEAFAAFLRRLNGTPAEVLDDPELLSLILPVLRADVTLSETHRYVPEPPLDCPIAAFGGRDDPESTIARLDEWRVHTTRAFERHLLPGDHFFLRESEGALLDGLRAALLGPGDAATCRGSACDDDERTTDAGRIGHVDGRSVVGAADATRGADAPGGGGHPGLRPAGT